MLTQDFINSECGTDNPLNSYPQRAVERILEIISQDKPRHLIVRKLDQCQELKEIIGDKSDNSDNPKYTDSALRLYDYLHKKD
jgi:hypothetical protein